MINTYEKQNNNYTNENKIVIILMINLDDYTNDKF